MSNRANVEIDDFGAFWVYLPQEYGSYTITRTLEKQEAIDDLKYYIRDLKKALKELEEVKAVKT